MGKVRLSPAAQEDIRDVRTYSKAAFGAAVARAYLEGLREVFGLLRERPRAGAEEANLGEALRSFGYRSHRIYYSLTGEDVLIVRILHHARDRGSVLRRP